MSDDIEKLNAAISMMWKESSVMPTSLYVPVFRHSRKWKGRKFVFLEEGYLSSSKTLLWRPRVQMSGAA